MKRLQIADCGLRKGRPPCATACTQAVLTGNSLLEYKQWHTVIAVGPSVTNPQSTIRNPQFPRIRNRSSGFSLLEVILALAILAGTIAILGELIGLGVRNAKAARDMTQAELLAESKMAEIAAGIVLPEATSGPCESDPDNWLYSVVVAPTDQEGLLSVTVTVDQNLTPEKRPASFSLVRWMRDPDAIATAEANAAAAESAASAE